MIGRARFVSTVLVFLAGTGGLAPRADATTAVAPLSIEQLTRYSDLAIQGHIESVAAYREGDRVYTDVGVRIDERLKGTHPSNIVTLKLYGGALDGRRTYVLGAPCLERGEEVVLFLRSNGTGKFNVVSLAEGKFKVVRTGRGATVSRDLRGIHYLDATVPSRIPESLDELRHAIRVTR